MSKILISICAWIIVCAAYWVFWSFVNLSFNPFEWGAFSRLCYGGFSVGAFFRALALDL